MITVHPKQRRAAFRRLWILIVIALGTGVLGTVLLRVLRNALEKKDANLLSGVLLLNVGFLYLALVICVIAAGFILLNRFYKSKFTDEGYLTFTLPARGWQIFLASLVNALAWMVIVLLAAFTAVFLMVYFGVGDLLESIADIHIKFNGEQAAEPLETLSSIVSFVSGFTLALTSITVGATVAKKHKLLAAVGIGYGISLVQNTLTTIVSLSIVMEATTITEIRNAYLLEIVMDAAFAAIGFFLSAYLMDKKLNLP